MRCLQYFVAMGQRIWTAEEIEQLSPAEQDALFEASVVASLDDVPEEFLAKVRQRFQQRAAGVDSPLRPQGASLDESFEPPSSSKTSIVSSTSTAIWTGELRCSHGYSQMGILGDQEGR